MGVSQGYLAKLLRTRRFRDRAKRFRPVRNYTTRPAESLARYFGGPRGLASVKTLAKFKDTLR
jgi:hypothetical protein